MNQPIETQAEQAVIERVASVLEEELGLEPELVLDGSLGDPDEEPRGKQRVHHVTTDEGGFYILTTVRTMTPDEARDYMTGGV